MIDNLGEGPMPSTSYERRMERVLSARVDEKIRSEAPGRAWRFLSLAIMAPTAAAGSFFLLKAAMLALQGPTGFFEAFGTAGQAAGVADPQLWLRGIDPVTEELARLMRPLIAGSRAG